MIRRPPRSTLDRSSAASDVYKRQIHLALCNEQLERRRALQQARGADAWTPKNRVRYVSAALQAYAAMTTSADTGAVRDVSQLQR